MAKITTKSRDIGPYRSYEPNYYVCRNLGSISDVLRHVYASLKITTHIVISVVQFQCSDNIANVCSNLCCNVLSARTLIVS